MENKLIEDKVREIINKFPLKKNKFDSESSLKDSIDLFSSLISLRVVTMLEESFGDLNFSSINEFSTIKEISDLIIYQKNKINNSNESKIFKNKFQRYNKPIERIGNFSIGIDIENIQSLPDDVFHFSQTNLRKKLFTPKEVIYSLNKENPKLTLLGIYCAKEAILKTEVNRYLKNINEIEIFHRQNGKPFTNFQNNKNTFDISITHSLDYVAAICMKY